MTHVRTAAKAIIIRDGRLLVTRNRNADGDWYALPGGGQSPGETLPDALIRECLEELGCRVRVGRLLFVRDYIGRNHEFADHDGGAHQVELMFECGLEPGEEPRRPTEPDSMQVGNARLDLSSLAEARIYPRELTAWLPVPDPALREVPHSVYWGDVN